MLRSKRTPQWTPVTSARFAHGQLPSQHSWTKTFAYSSSRILYSLEQRAQLEPSCIVSGNKPQGNPRFSHSVIRT